MFDLIINLFIFDLIFDPRNNLFYAKEILFFLSILCFVFSSKKFTIYPFVFFALCGIYLAFIFSFCIGYFYNFSFDSNVSILMLKCLIPCILLGWSRGVDVLPAYMKGCYVISIVTWSLFLLSYFDAGLFDMIYKYIASKDYFIMIAERNIYGIVYKNILYITAPLLLVIIPVALYRFYTCRKNKLFRLLLFLLLFSAILISGNRASIAIGCMAVLLTVFWIYSPIKRFLLCIFCIVLFLCFIFNFYDSILGSFAADNSSSVRIGHLYSYIEFFMNYPLCFFTGSGPGSIFYSIGFEKYCAYTELSLLEILRQTGFWGLLCFLVLYLYPCFLLLGKKNEIPYAIPALIGYLSFFIVATTNPFLLNSTGFLALWLIFSISENPCNQIQLEKK